MPGYSAFDNGTLEAGLLNPMLEETGELRELYNKDTPLRDVFDAQMLGPGAGSSIRSGPFVLRPGHNVGFRGQDAFLPNEARTVGTVTASRDALEPLFYEVFPYTGYAGIRLSGVTDSRLVNNPAPNGSYDLLRVKLQTSTSALRRLTCHSMFAQNAGLGEVASVAAGGVITLRIHDGTATNYFQVGTMRFTVGDYIQFRSPGGVFRGSLGHRITEIRSSTVLVVTPAADASVVAGDLLCEGDANGGSWDRQPDSIWAGAGTAAQRLVYNGISRAAYPEWSGTISTGAGALRECSDTIILQHMFAQGQRLGLEAQGNAPDLLVMRPGIWLEPMFGLRLGAHAGGARTQVGMIEDVNYQPTQYPAGVSSATIELPGWGPIRKQYYSTMCAGTIFALNTKSWHVRTWNGGPKLVDDGAGGRGLLRIPNFHLYDAIMFLQEAVYCSNPMQNGIITELIQNVDWVAA